MPVEKPLGPRSRQEGGSASGAEASGQGSKIDGPAVEDADEVGYSDEEPEDDVTYEESAKELKRLCDMCESGQSKVSAESATQASDADGRVRLASTGA